MNKKGSQERDGTPDEGTRLPGGRGGKWARKAAWRENIFYLPANPNLHLIFFPLPFRPNDNKTQSIFVVSLIIFNTSCPFVTCGKSYLLPHLFEGYFVLKSNINVICKLS